MASRKPDLSCYQKKEYERIARAWSSDIIGYELVFNFPEDLLSTRGTILMTSATICVLTAIFSPLILSPGASLLFIAISTFLFFSTLLVVALSKNSHLNSTGRVIHDFGTHIQEQTKSEPEPGPAVINPL
jgi:hypothetical protein